MDDAQEGGSVTRLLFRARTGESAARVDLFQLLYTQLHALAERHAPRDGDRSLAPTVLVHELFLKLVGAETLSCHDRSHFFAVCATAMRQIVVDRARKARTRKRDPGALDSGAVDELVAGFERRAIDLIALDDALQRLAAFDPELARLVELRFFAGLSIEDCAAALDIVARTVRRRWHTARAWLRRELER